MGDGSFNHRDLDKILFFLKNFFIQIIKMKINIIFFLKF
jgi:hypothetical protein